MRVLWLVPPSRIPGEYPLVSQNRWIKSLPYNANQIYPVLNAYGVSLLLSRGFDVQFLDAPLRGLTADDVVRISADFDLVIMELRTAFANWIYDLSWMMKLNRRDIRIAVYGPHAVSRPKEALAWGIDHVVTAGDFDYGVLSLVEQISCMQSPPGEIYVPLQQDLDELPFLNREAVPWRDYFESWRHRRDFGWLQSGRGCFGYCTFCSWVYNYYRHHMRFFSAKRAYAELVRGMEDCGIREFLDDSDTFPIPYGVSLADRILADNLDVFWDFQTRADLVADSNLPQLDFLRRSGLHTVKLGLDAGNEYSLKRIGKDVTLSQCREGVRKLKDVGLEVHVNMILGYPWEDAKTAYDTVRFVQRLKPNQAQFSLLQPLVGTPLHREAVEKGWFVSDPHDYDAFQMKSPILEGEMCAADIAKLYRDAWRMFYFSPAFILGQLGKSLAVAAKEGNLDTFRHLWSGFKAVYYGHMRAIDGSN